MFNKQGGELGPIQGPEQPPVLPALRTFKVTRAEWSREDVYEVIVVHAHGIMVSEGDRTIFQTWRLDPVLGPQLQVSRILVCVVDLEDVTPEVSGSRILH